MSQLKPFGTFPTPYGVSVPVYRPETIDPADPERVLFSMDATAICAGIYDKADRDCFDKDARRLGHMPDPAQYGGRRLLHVPLPRPVSPAYPRLTSGFSETPIENWTDGVMERHRWCDRAEFLIDIIGDNMERNATGGGLAQEVYPLGISIMLTATLEHHCETEIDCLEAAALYALCEHKEWRGAAIEWLSPVRGTWFRDWRIARPRYTTFAKTLMQWLDLPLWLTMPGEPT